MKRYIKSATTPYEYNQSQTAVGSALKTLKGSRIARYKSNVGKEIGGSIYVHKDYALDVVPQDVLYDAEESLHKYYPYFKYNCIKYDKKTQTISFQEVPDFDTAREPVVGDYIIVKPSGECKEGHSNYIFHHKWLWVRNDYTGFNVADSWNWSKEWLSVLPEPSDGNGIARWNAQLDKYNLPKENTTMKRQIKSSVAIQAAVDSAGTTFYEVTDEMLQDFYRDDKNIVLTYLVRNEGLDAFDTVETAVGSAMIDGILYVCVTDGAEIDVNGELVDPEYALDEYSLEELSDYIVPADDEVLKRFVSQYELRPVDLDDIAIELLNAGHSFSTIVQDAADLDLLDNIL